MLQILYTWFLLCQIFWLYSVLFILLQPKCLYSIRPRSLAISITSYSFTYSCPEMTTSLSCGQHLLIKFNSNVLALANMLRITQIRTVLFHVDPHSKLGANYCFMISKDYQHVSSPGSTFTMNSGMINIVLFVFSLPVPSTEASTSISALEAQGNGLIVSFIRNNYFGSRLKQLRHS